MIIHKNFNSQKHFNLIELGRFNKAKKKIVKFNFVNIENG